MKLLNYSLKHFYKDLKKNLQNKMRGSEFEFDGINFFYYSFNKTSIYRGGTYISLLTFTKMVKR